MLMTVN